MARNSIIYSAALKASTTFPANSYCAHRVLDKKLHRAEAIPSRMSGSKLPATHTVIFTVVLTARQTLNIPPLKISKVLTQSNP